MSSAAPNATEDRPTGVTPRRAAVAAGVLGLATLAGLALGAPPAFTQQSDRVSLASVGNASPASASDQQALEEEARQAAVRELARAMLKKNLAEQAVAMQAPVPPPAQAASPAPAESAPATTGSAASATLADKTETPVATTRTGSAQLAAIPTPPATEQTASLDPEDMQRLAGKAAEAIRSGDIASARLVLEHAVRAGDATALYALAETYDPRVLVKLRVQGMQGEPDTARELYQKALDSGVEEARARL